MGDYTLGKIQIDFSALGADKTTKDIGNVQQKVNSISKSLDKFSKLNTDKISSIINGINNIDFSGLNNASQSLKNLDAENINKFSNGLYKLQSIELSRVNENLAQLSMFDFSKLSNLAQSFEMINGDNINKFSNALKKLSNLNFENLNLEEITTTFGRLATAVEPFVNQLIKAEASLVAMDSVIKKIDNSSKKASTSTNKLGKNSEKASKHINKMFSLGQIYFFLNYTKRIADGLASIVTSAINFDETLNKFQVSMGNNYEQSLKFVNDITKAFNLSRESIMNYQSTFKNMLDALGDLETDTTYQLSETLTRMAIDYSSLFNVQIEKAMEQFQGVLAGNIRSIRSVSGYDVSEQTIFNIYRELGGTKTMRQLDQTEKRLLRIIALQQQMEKTGAVGDFEKTITNVSNVLKQIQDTIKEIGTYVGQLLKGFIAPILEYVLGALVAVREIAKTITILSGYQYEDFGGGGLFGDVEDSAESAEEAVDSLKRVLLGFDELNILGSSSSSTEQLTDDYSFLTNKIKEYSSMLSDIENKYAKISEKILEWAGFSYNAESDLWEYIGSEKTTNDIIEFIFSRINDLTDKIISQVAEKIGELFENLPEIIKTFFNILDNVNISIENILPKIIDIIVEIIVKVLENLSTIVDRLTNSTQDISAIVTDAIVYAIEKIANQLPEIIESIIKTIFSLIKSTSILTGDVIFDIIQGVVDGILELIEGAINSIPVVINNIDDFLMLLIDVLIGIIPKLVNIITEIIVKIFDALPKIITSLLSVGGEVDLSNLDEVYWKLVKTIYEVLISIVKLIVTLLYKIVEFLPRLIATMFGIEELETGLNGLESNITNFFDTISDYLDEFFDAERIRNGIKQKLRSIGDWIISKFTQVRELLQGERFSKVREVIDDIANFFQSIGNWFVSVFNKIKSAFSQVGELLQGGRFQKSTTISTSAKSSLSSSNYQKASSYSNNQNSILGNLQNAITNGFSQMVSTFKNSANNPIYLNARKVSEEVYTQFTNIALKRGKNLSI